MNGLMKKAGLGAVLAATAITTAAPAEAQRWRRYNRGGGDVAAGALLGGVVGLGLGAAIASGNRGRYYDDGYYYGPRPRARFRNYYYAPPPPPPVVVYRGYGGGYYGGPYGGGYAYPYGYGYRGW